MKFSLKANDAMKLQLAIATVALLCAHAVVVATPVDRQVDAPRTRVTPNKMTAVGGPKTPVNKRSGMNGKITNQFVQKNQKSFTQGSTSLR